jgi:MFS family permease
MQELMTYRFLTGVGGSLQMTGAQLYLSDISNHRNRARTISPLMAAFSAGQALGPAIGGLLFEQFGIRPLFGVVGGCIGTIAIYNYFILPETKVIEDRAPSTEPKKRSSRNEITQEFRKTWGQWKDLMKDKDMRAALIVSLGFWFAAAGCTFTLMPLYAYSHLGISAVVLGSYFTLMSIINVAGSQAGAWVLDKFGRKKVRKR